MGTVGTMLYTKKSGALSTARAKAEDADGWSCKADGIDLNKGMVESGWAKADTHETKMFADYEAKPKAAGIGLWQNNLMVRLH